MKRLSVKKVALLGVLTALSLLMFIVESLLSSLVLPGAKIGLSNIFTLLSLFLLGPIEAIILVVARTVLGSVIVGSLSQLMFSLTAGLVSVIVAIIIYILAFDKVSIIALSVLSATIHNIVQTAVFCLITMSTTYFSLLLYLVPLGIIAGALVGVVTQMLIKYIPKSFAEKLL
ncbi:MAG: Gx transporter family protein [Clostridiales bacterium]|nr:Gx transporter family protein [Clostridiales bacterium]